MKRNHTITLAQAIDGFLLHLAARRLSPHTIADYTNSLRRLQRFLGGDPPLAAITIEQIEAFFADLATPHAPAGIARRPAQAISKKHSRNIHTGLSAFWTWAIARRLVTDHLIRRIERPRPEERAIVPLSQAEVKAILDVCDRSRPYTRPGKRENDHARTTGQRDRAIILLLLDTGVRASELCDLEIQHVDLKAQRILVYGKGDKERALPISARTSRSLWQYLAIRPEVRLDDPLFLTITGQPMNRSNLLQLLHSLGERAGVPDVHPHRFRHTFAVNFLRNGGNAYELQMALGHATLEMTRTYLELAQTDLAAAHLRASPVDRWRL